MSKILIEDGKIRITQGAIEEISKAKGFDLSCQINEDGIKVDIKREIFGFDLPVHIFIKNLEINKEMLKLKDFNVLIGGMKIPPVTFLPFLKKYKFIALDMENNIINVNLKEIIPDYFKYEIEKIILKNEEIEIKTKYITILLLNLVT